MMPQLGVLASINKKAANEVFDRDCLIHLGTCICPSGERKEGKTALKIKGDTSSGKKIDNEYKYGQMGIIELGMDETADVTLYPSRGLDVGEGPGNEIEVKIYGGVVGIIVDCRGRPLTLPEDMSKRRKKLEEWNKTLGIYPE
jgi:hypothetical protein